MKQDLQERIRNYGADKLEELKNIGTAAGIVLGVGIPLIYAYAGAMYLITTHFEKIIKTAEWAVNNPYETLFGTAGVVALGIGAYNYIERKLHVAKTLDNFVEKAKKNSSPVNIEFRYGRGLDHSGEYIKLKAGKIRYETYYECETFTINESGFGCARAKAGNVLGLIETAITLAEDLKKKKLEIRIKGKDIEYAKNYLAKCKEWAEKGYTFIAG